MRQVALNMHAAIMLNGQSSRKPYNASKSGTNGFDKIFADKFNENTSSKASRNSQMASKSIRKPGGNVNISNEDPTTIEEETKKKAGANKKGQKLASEILAIIQSMEGLMQQINIADMSSGEFSHEGLQGMMDDLKVQLSEVLAQAEQFNPSNHTANDFKSFDLKLIKSTMLDAISALENMEQSNLQNMQSTELDGILTKLQGVIGNQLEIFHGLAKTSMEEHPTGLLNHMKLDDGTNQEKGLKEIGQNNENSEELHMASKTIYDENDEESQDSMEHGSAKQEGFLSGMKISVENMDPYQAETQVVKFEQVNIVGQTKSETSMLQMTKSNSIIEQVADKVMVHVGDEGSEMSLQLKPEHLGKLTMKVSIERGIVVANFVAESQMVKEVLESNFNVLKDALTEKGLAVQELNVFVGSDSNFQNQSNFMSFQRKMNKGNNSYNETVYGNVIEEISPMAPKSLNSSKLDFFA